MAFSGTGRLLPHGIRILRASVSIFNKRTCYPLSYTIVFASRFLVKEVSVVQHSSTKQRLRKTIRSFQEKLPLADEDIQRFSVPDDPPISLAKDFLHSLQAEIGASTEKNQWLKQFSNSSSAECLWLGRFTEHVWIFSRSFTWDNEDHISHLAQSCCEKASLLLLDTVAANAFIAMIAGVMAYNMYQTDCIIRYKPKGIKQSIDHQGSSQNQDLKNHLHLKAKENLDQDRNRLMGYLQPLSGKEKILVEQDRNGKDDAPLYTYHWLFLAFHALTFDCGEDAIEAVDMRASRVSTEDSHDGVLPRIIEAFARVYDNALWGFRVPIRNIEKHRREPVISMTRRRSSTTATDFFELTKSYSDMHELSRHIDHFLETLRAAKNTINAIVVAERDSQVSEKAAPANSGLTGHSESIVSFWALFIANLELRAASFKDRLENEISLVMLCLGSPGYGPVSDIVLQAFHVVNVLQLGQARELLEESRDEGKTVARYVAYASMVFLPGRFVSGFFSMTFFGFDTTKDKSWRQSHQVWIYFLITIPWTVAGLAVIRLKTKTMQLKGVFNNKEKKAI